MQENMGKVSEGQVVESVVEQKVRQVMTNAEQAHALIASSDSFFLGLSIRKGTELTHYFIQTNFEALDLLPSWAKIRGLIVDTLQESSTNVVNNNKTL